MVKEKNVTKRQHYIPQVYMRGFSPQYQNGQNDIPLSRYTIYCYSLKNNDKIKNPIPIKSICYKDYLYELTDCQGQFVEINHLEKYFAEIERKLGCYRGFLEKKVFIQDNYNTRCFLTTEEKVFWITYISIQILRDPHILELAEAVSLETFEKEINVEQAKNIARMVCLPFWKKLEDGGKETIILKSIFEPMLNMSFGIGVDKQAGIITSDRPVVIISEEYPCEEYGMVVFPISSQICLFLFGKDKKKLCQKNFLFPIGDDQRKEINMIIAKSAYETIYSRSPLKNREILEYLSMKRGKTHAVL